MSVGASAESVPGEVRRVRMAGVRTHYREELAALEASTLADLDLVTEQVEVPRCGEVATGGIGHESS